MGRMLQHECDHLDGHVYLDRLEKEERREALRYMRNRQVEVVHTRLPLAGAVERSETEGWFCRYRP